MEPKPSYIRYIFIWKNYLMEDKLILVDEEDTVIGEISKLLTHKLGKLNRAFSIYF